MNKHVTTPLNRARLLDTAQSLITGIRTFEPGCRQVTITLDDKGEMRVTYLSAVQIDGR